jgi:hypothetical protein
MSCGKVVAAKDGDATNIAAATIATAVEYLIERLMSRLTSPARAGDRGATGDDKEHADRTLPLSASVTELPLGELPQS